MGSISHPPPRTRADPACSSHGNDRSAREQAPKHRHLPTLWLHPVCQCSTVQKKSQGVGRAEQGRVQEILNDALTSQETGTVS